VGPKNPAPEAKPSRYMHWQWKNPAAASLYIKRDIHSRDELPDSLIKCMRFAVQYR
jgi:hypothetical protein